MGEGVNFFVVLGPTPVTTENECTKVTRPLKSLILKP